MISIDDALRSYQQELSPLPPRPLPLAEAAGATLAEDLPSLIDLPRTTQSAMDGYALRGADLAHPPRSLPIAMTVAAGMNPPALAPGACARIFTGAPLPPGADTVIIQEQVRVANDQAHFAAAAIRGANVRQRGEEIRAGARILWSGTRLDAASLSLAAAGNHASLRCHPLPRVALLVTGDELRPAGSRLAPAQIPESNGVFLHHFLAEQGIFCPAPRLLGDDPGALGEALKTALADSDLVIVSGGASVGERDHSRRVAMTLGVREVFWSVAQKPGKPLSFGIAPGGPAVLILPGNPASVFVTAVVHLRAVLARLNGRPAPYLVRGKLAKALRSDPRRERLVRAAWRLDGEVGFEPLPNQASHMLGNLPACDVLLRVPANTDLPVGASLPAWPVR